MNAKTNGSVNSVADITPTERPPASGAGKSLLKRAAELEAALEKLAMREAEAAARAAVRVHDRFKDKRNQLIAADPEAYDVMRGVS